MQGSFDGKWKEFEAWIRNAIGGDFTWKVRPRDNVANRKMVANVIEETIKDNNGKFPASNSFIERLDI